MHKVYILQCKLMCMSKTQICVLCDAKFSEWGNNPYPLADPEETCCSTCNTTKVIPRRLWDMAERDRKKERELIIELIKDNL